MKHPHEFLDEIIKPWWMGGWDAHRATPVDALDPAKLGRGIGLSLYAVASGSGIDSPEAWVHFCVTAAAEAYAVVVEAEAANPAPPKKGSVEEQLVLMTGHRPQQPPATSEATLTAAHHAALMAFRLCMPKLTGRRATQAYIACVAAGVQRAYFTGSEAKSLLYTAQLALAAYPSRRAQPGRKR